MIECAMNVTKVLQILKTGGHGHEIKWTGNNF